MLKKTLLTAGLVIGLASPVFAASCPMDMQAIDAAMKSSKLSATDKATVMTLRTEGEALHEAGNHAASVEKLGEAKTLLGLDT